MLSRARIIAAKQHYKRSDAIAVGDGNPIACISGQLVECASGLLLRSIAFITVQETDERRDMMRVRLSNHRPI